MTYPAQPSRLVYPVILAAGSSSRLGKPKQLLQYKGRPLLQHAVDAACELVLLAKDNVAVAVPIVVLGADAQSIVTLTNLHAVHILKNDDWATGMAGSIKLAVQHIGMQNVSASGIILLLADQPHISAALLLQLLLNRKDEGRGYCGQSFV